MVWEGVKPGIYETWSECHAQVKNFPGARYKGYTSLAEAEDAFYSEHAISLKKTPKKTFVPASNPEIRMDSISVDAACSGNPGILEYRGVITATGKEIFRQGPFEHGTNNIGEFLALVHGLAMLKSAKNAPPIIYSDSRTAMAWVRNKAVKTTLKRTKKNEFLFELMERALIWLKANTYTTKVIKWETKKWGEIPADFGRK